MAEIITVGDLPTAVQSNELVATMVAGANSKASRVAPCLVAPTSDAWAATTAYVAGDQVKLADGEYLEVTVDGTSAASEPTAPTALNGTVADGTVTWKLIAPSADQLAEAKLVLIGAVKRWADAGSGAYQTQQAGPFAVGVDTRQRTGFNLWPSEIGDLEAICRVGDDTARGGAFGVDTAPSLDGIHLPWCTYSLGGNYCSCGVDIAGEPIYELG